MYQNLHISAVAVAMKEIKEGDEVFSLRHFDLILAIPGTLTTAKQVYKLPHQTIIPRAPL